MEPVALALVALVGLAVGIGLGFAARSQWANQSIKAATEKAARIVGDARAQQKDLILEAKEEKIRLQREAEDDARERRGELTNIERRLHARDEQLDQRADMLEQRDRKLLEKQIELDKGREDLEKLNQERVLALEKVSGLSAEDAKAVLLEAIREEAEHDAVKLARSIERRAREEANEKARDIIVTAMQRVAADHTAEHTVTVVHLPNDEMKGRIIGREGRNIRALEQATGIDLIIDDTPETVVLSGFDPVRREIARLSLMKLMGDGRIHPGRIEEVVAKSRAEVDLTIRQAGEQAAYDCGVPGLPPDVLKLLGRLKFRTSYGQNVLQHSIETSFLGAMIASELGADVMAAKMGGLLHDIGKAVDHEVEGPHAAIGAVDRAEGTSCRSRSSTASPRTTRRSSTPAWRRRSSRSPTRSPRRGPAPAARRWRRTSSGSRISRASPRASPGSRSRSPSRPGARCGSSFGPTRSTTCRPRGSRATSSRRSRNS